MATTVKIKDTITVGALAEQLKMPVTQLIGELMKNGVMATVNEKLDYDTAEIIVAEMGLDVQLEREQATAEAAPQPRAKKAAGANAQSRPPVVAVMGHVDHGKTSLLDKIRGAEVAAGEAGGITQHISAYQVERNKRLITFLDTPGHEAFAAIREHSARLTDIVVLVVAADDGVKPQTIEAIRFARQAGVKIVVAINKMDKPAANPDLVLGQLAEQKVVTDKWKDGDTPVVEVSAKTGQGVDDLLDMILLTADVDDLKADSTGPAEGLIIEARYQKGLGPVAHGLVETGTLHQGDSVVVGGTYAKLRTLADASRHKIAQATASTPVVMTGFKELPEFGQEFWVAENDKAARAAAAQNAQNAKQIAGKQDLSGGELIKMINRSRDIERYAIIVKADVQGSLTSVIDSLKALDTNEVVVDVVAASVGVVSENDIYLAHSSQADIYGFGVSMPRNVRQIASRDNVSVKLYDVIYELIEEVRQQLSARLKPQVVEEDLGRMVVKGVFKTTAKEVICGGEVTKGTLRVPSLARISRGDQVIAEEVEVTMLKRGPQETKEVQTGEMCGLSFKTDKRVQLEEGDRLELFQRRIEKREL